MAQFLRNEVAISLPNRKCSAAGSVTPSPACKAAVHRVIVFGLLWSCLILPSSAEDPEPSSAEGTQLSSDEDADHADHPDHEEIVAEEERVRQIRDQLEGWLAHADDHLNKLKEAKERLQARDQLAADIPSIMARFDEIDEKTENLKSKYLELQMAVVAVKEYANRTRDEMVHAESTLVDAMTVAQQNKVTAAALMQEFAGTAAKIQATEDTMKTLKNSLSGVEQTAAEMRQSGVTVGEKVGKLEMAVHELLPGKEYLPTRIQRARDQLQQYQDSLASGEVEPAVASTIRGNFLRAQHRTERLAQDPPRASAAEGDEQDEGGGDSD